MFKNVSPASDKIKQSMVQNSEIITFHTRAMHLLHGVGSSAQMPVSFHFVYINCNTKSSVQPLGMEIAIYKSISKSFFGRNKERREMLWQSIKTAETKV